MYPIILSITINSVENKIENFTNSVWSHRKHSVSFYHLEAEEYYCTKIEEGLGDQNTFSSNNDSEL